MYSNSTRIYIISCYTRAQIANFWSKETLVETVNIYQLKYYYLTRTTMIKNDLLKRSTLTKKK